MTQQNMAATLVTMVPQSHSICELTINSEFSKVPYSSRFYLYYKNEVKQQTVKWSAIISFNLYELSRFQYIRRLTQKVLIE